MLVDKHEVSLSHKSHGIHIYVKVKFFPNLFLDDYSNQTLKEHRFCTFHYPFSLAEIARFCYKQISKILQI